MHITILVTGGCGFIGSNFVLNTLHRSQNIKIVNIDKLTYAANPSNLRSLEFNNNYFFEYADICNKSDLIDIFSFYKPDMVVNFAAETHVDRSIIDSSDFIRSNILGTANLLEVSKDYWTHVGMGFDGHRFLQVSTDEVYGSSSLMSVNPFDETSSLSPSNPYAATKASADLLALSYYQTYSFPVLITRSVNNYGPMQHNEKLIPNVISKAFHHSAIPIYGNGENMRSWIHVNDNCSALYEVLFNGRLGEVYNISSMVEMSNISLVNILLGLMQNITGDSQINDSLIKFVSDRASHDLRYFISNEKLLEELNWSPQIAFDEGLASTIEWYLNSIL